MIVLDIKFIANEKFREILPEPQPSSNLFPQWFSEMRNSSSGKCPLGFSSPNNIWDIQYRKNVDTTTNVTGCPGITDFLKYGYIIPAWDNFIFREYNGDITVNWTDNYVESKAKFHGNQQYSTIPKESQPLYDCFIKIDSPWIIRTSPGVSVLITHPVWHRNNTFTTASGILHTDETPFNVPWFFEWNHKIQNGMNLETMDLENQIIGKGTPIMLVIPFYRNKFDSSVEYVSGSEFERLGRIQEVRTTSLFNNHAYAKLRKTIGKLFK